LEFLRYTNTPTINVKIKEDTTKYTSGRPTDLPFSRKNTGHGGRNFQYGQSLNLNYNNDMYHP
jgi:hypothetical protein